MRSLWKLKVVVGALMLTSCGAQYHLKRAIAKDPTIVQKEAVKLDTVVITEIKAVRDTFVLERVDTITLQRNGVRIELKRSYDTIMVDAECLPDTIRIEKEIFVPQVVYEEKTPTFGVYKLILVLIILLLILSLIAYFSKLFKIN